MDDVEKKILKVLKADTIKSLSSIDIDSYQLKGVDKRLYSYVNDLISNPSQHNLFELLALLRFFKLIDTYIFKKKRSRNLSYSMRDLNFLDLRRGKGIN